MRIFSSSTRPTTDDYIHLGYLSANNSVYNNASGLILPGFVVVILGALLLIQRKDGRFIYFSGPRLLGAILLVAGVSLIYVGATVRWLDPWKSTNGRLDNEELELGSLGWEHFADSDRLIPRHPMLDGWEHPLNYRKETFPDRVRIVISSNGEDGIAGTSDDMERTVVLQRPDPKPATSPAAVAPGVHQ